jgi:hypothetical protein
MRGWGSVVISAAAAAAAAAAIASAQSGSVCTSPEPLACLEWSAADGNVTFSATFTGYQSAPVAWGAWGVSSVFCGNMFPATMWIAYLTASGHVIVEDRQAVGHVVPRCYASQLSQQLSGSASPGNKTLKASWTRPAVPPPEYAAMGYTALSGAEVPLIAANFYEVDGVSPLIPDEPCTLAIPGHSIAVSGITGNLLLGGADAGTGAAAGIGAAAGTVGGGAARHRPRCRRRRERAVNLTALSAAAPAPAPAPPYSGLVGTFSICSESVTVLGYLGASGDVGYAGTGTGGSDDLINGFNVAIDPVGRILYALGANEGAVEALTLFGFSVDTGALVSSCKTPLFSPPFMGRDMFLAFDPAAGDLVASGCADQACKLPLPIGFLNRTSCSYQVVASIGGEGQTSAYESAAYNSDTQQVVFTLANSTGAAIVAVSLADGSTTRFDETALDNIDSLAYDAASGLIYGVGQQGFVASLVAVNSSDFSYAVVGVISQAADAFNGLGVVGGGAQYFFLMSDPRSGSAPPTLAAVDLATGALKSSTPIQYCNQSLFDCPTTLSYQP